MSDEIIDSRVERIFNCALRFDKNKRKKYLERACKGRPTLRVEVDSLLETAANSSDFLLGLSQRISRLAVFDPILTNELPSKIGAWNLLSLLGEGGMGRVYKVVRDDGQYHQLAALKILPISASDEMSKYRFRAERQILAGLSHKNIVQLLDGGVTQEGVPYFVMEYVNGVPIDQYCQNVGLDFRERLNLFLDICNAVQYAHDNMVIHRDLKPNNILINNNGEVKLLDFGIAKFLRGDLSSNDATSPAFRHLTPAYASPQMLRGENVDVKTDVYSLGVLLYKLLSGVKPYNNCENAAQLIKGHHETRAETIMPSLAAPTKKMRRMLSGDLDNIARKALSVSVDERYQSVANFSDDVRAYLNGFPVVARSGGILYKIKRFIIRNIYASILSCLTMLIFLVFAYFYMRKNSEAELQTKFANYQQQRAMLSNDFITVLLNEIGLEDKPMSEEALLQLAEDFVLKQAEFSPALSGWLMFDISLKYGLVARGDKGNYLMTKASQLMLQAEEIARKQQDNDLLRAVLCMQAHRDFYTNPSEAIKKINRSVRLPVKEAFSVESTIACAIAEAKEYEYLGKSELALRKINKNIDNYSLHHSPYSTLYFKLFNAKGLILYRRNRFEEAFNTNSTLLEMLKQAGHEKSRYYLTLEGNRALVLEAMGDLQRATVLREEMIRKVSGQIKDSFFMKNIWVDHVFCLTRLGRYQEAAIIYQREFGGLKTQRAWGLTLSREINLHISYAYHLVALNELEQARFRLNVARDLLASVADQRSKLRRYLYIDFVEAMLLKKSGFEGESGAVMRELMGKIRDLKGGVRGFLMLAYFQGVKMGIDHGEYVEAERDALNMLSNASKNAGEDGVSGDIGLARLVLAQIYQKRGQHELASENFSRAAIALRQGYGKNHSFSIQASTASENNLSAENTRGKESVSPVLNRD